MMSKTNKSVAFIAGSLCVVFIIFFVISLVGLINAFNEVREQEHQKAITSITDSACLDEANGAYRTTDKAIDLGGYGANDAHGFWQEDADSMWMPLDKNGYTINGYERPTTPPDTQVVDCGK